jgi:hypothetical protein
MANSLRELPTILRKSSIAMQTWRTPADRQSHPLETAAFSHTFEAQVASRVQQLA